MPGPIDDALKLEEGQVEEARKMLLLLGREQLGEPTAKIMSLLDAVTDVRRLENLAIRVLHVKSWEELLASNGTARRPRRRNNA